MMRKSICACMATCMLPVVLVSTVAAVPTAAAAAVVGTTLPAAARGPWSGCATEADCQLNGACVPAEGAGTVATASGARGTCECHAGWTGRDCGLLDVLPSAEADFPGLAYGVPPSSSGEGGLAAWGGSIVADPQRKGKFHVFAAEMSLGCGLNSWYRNSRIIHGTAASPLGPFVREEPEVTGTGLKEIEGAAAGGRPRGGVCVGG